MTIFAWSWKALQDLMLKYYSNHVGQTIYVISTVSAYYSHGIVERLWAILSNVQLSVSTGEVSNISFYQVLTAFMIMSARV